VGRITTVGGIPAFIHDGGNDVQVRIGVQSVPRELVVETPMSPDEVEQAVTDAVTDEDGVLTLKGQNGSRVVVPAAKLAYVEIDEAASKSVGFGTF
jgi:hypothetical protein